MSEPRPRAFLQPPHGWPVGVGALATTRLGGLALGADATLALGSGGGEPPAAVRANRRRLAARLALPTAPVWLRQEHGTRVIAAHEVAPGDPPPAADGAWTDRAGTVCAVLTADCLPVVLAAADASAVGVAHAGWRGLSGGIIEATLAALPVPAGSVHAWLGPAIGARVFEVGPEVRDAFVADDPAQAAAFRPGSGDRWHADLYELCRRRLRRAGVARITGGGWCTHTQRELFFSHRREPQATARMATLAWLAPPSGGRSP